MVFGKMNLCTFNSMCHHHMFVFAKFPLCLQFLSMLHWYQDIQPVQAEVLCCDTATSRVVCFRVGSLDHLHHSDPRCLLLMHISGAHPTTPEAEFLEVEPWNTLLRLKTCSCCVTLCFSF